MDFKECIENNIITKTSPDLSRAVKMVETADIRYRFWDKDIDDEFITLKVEAYYEIIKELILAIIC